MKLWIDENVHSHVIKALKQAGHEIRMAKRGTDDIPDPHQCCGGECYYYHAR